MRRARRASHTLSILAACCSFTLGCYVPQPIVGLPQEEQWVRLDHPEGFVFLQPRRDPDQPWVTCRATSARGRVVHSGTDTLRLVRLNSVQWLGKNPDCGDTDEFRVVYADSPALQVRWQRFRPARTATAVVITTLALSLLALQIAFGGDGY